MNRSEILNSISWKEEEEWFGTAQVVVPVLGGKIEIQFLVENERDISDRSVRIVNELLQLDESHLIKIKHFLWEDCKLYCEATGYGFDVSEGKNETEVNHREFGVFNETDAYRTSNLLYVMICEEDEKFEGNYARLTFDNEWNGNLCVVVMKGGDIVGYGDDGLYIGEFEDVST
ncbi:hypothetical protein HCH_01457 [Hahella chejuensis KCTC 2396]|uniref:DUF6985 domain-containing protein n=1 Tax=Hahella chejuensis (strain KCTC 2396) TaxID=349521 RepID=Q2SM07_HAHCH|nr:hypothetical protein [Hahella chejuensis]ABC28317.1 hypothetical protein HCH_01457 [Hahella chejuensis KCTC 2396]